MKKLWIWLLIFWAVFLWGCGKKFTTAIVFEKYSLIMKTPFHYQEITNTQAASSIIKQYINWTSLETWWFISSLLVSKNEVISGTSITWFAETNTKTSLKKIPQANQSTKKTIAITCNKQKFKAILTSLKIEDKKTYYLTQIYFMDNGYGYIISAMTQKSTENKDIIKSFWSLSCI